MVYRYAEIPLLHPNPILPIVRAMKVVLGILGWLGLMALWLHASVALGQGRISTMPVNALQNPDGTPAEDDPGPFDTQTFVSFIDNAVPRTQVRLRFDAGYDLRRNDRSSYLFPQSGFPGAMGFQKPEPRVHAQEFNTYIEYAAGSAISLFVETPMRWVNPVINDNVWGQGDLNLGFKFVCWADDHFFTTLQFRGYVPTAGTGVLGTEHFSVEPALLINYRIYEMIRLEGEARYWVPLGGTPHAGDIIRYGLGLSYGERTPGKIWFAPVIEAVGWTILGGQESVFTGPGAFYTQGAEGTIVNVYGGVRIGLGDQMDLYAGYGRFVTGDYWYRDMWRVEFRLLF